MVIIRIRISSKPDQSEALEQAVSEQSPKVREQAGCVTFELFRSAEQPNQYLLYEEWQDRASFEAYKDSVPFKAIGAALPPMLAGKPDSAYYEGGNFFDG